MKFDRESVQRRIDRVWALDAKFGMERGRYHTYLEEIVSDRYTLVAGTQILRDEVQFADWRSGSSDVKACGADFNVPSVVTTVAYTNCGDRIHQGEAASYRRTVAARFATMSEVGDVKLESFSPTGGGTDDGATLAHVTVAHQIDAALRARVYEGNAESFLLVAIDLKTHVGRLDTGDTVSFGSTRESPWRTARNACGAIVGTLGHYDENNQVHRRIRGDLGEANYRLLSDGKVVSDEGIEINSLVAASIVAVQGMRNTALALASELDERGVGHLTACLTVNRMSMTDPVIYLARAMVFGGKVQMQGVGCNAREYGARLVGHEGDRRIQLRYRGSEGAKFEVGDLTEHSRQS